MKVEVEIICVGNELLIGKTLNTNSHWIAGRTTALGANVRRITVASDDVDEIASSIREALRRKPRFIITTGGLGPTFDDKTLEGIAKGLAKEFEVNEKALELVRSKYEALVREGRIDKVELTPSRVKMATFPKGGKPLNNPVGTAPGMLAEAGKTTVIALPGVPPEMEAIFDGSVAPLLKGATDGSAFYEASLYVEGIMESSLAPLIDRTMHDNPLVYVKSHVYVKSRAQVEGKKSHIELHFSTTSEDPNTGKTCLEKAILQLSELVRSNDGEVSSAEAGTEK